MDEFSGYIFKENTEKTESARASKERVFLIGILIFLVAVVLMVLGLEHIAVYPLIIGFIVFIVGQFVMSGVRPSIGHRPYAFKILKDGILIGQEKLNLDITQDLTVRINSFKGQMIDPGGAIYQMNPGTDNKIQFRFQGKDTEFSFILESEHAKLILVAFCKEHGIRCVK